MKLLIKNFEIIRLIMKARTLRKMKMCDQELSKENYQKELQRGSIIAYILIVKKKIF